ncbi:MAG: 3'-5' exonuclease [Candidatus Paceibacterota bacterium]|jgi:DNA polymerase-3 subunit epsilon
MKLLFFDLETAGLSPTENGIHQISGCIEIDGVEKECFDFKVAPNPSLKISDEALRVSNKTREEVVAYPPMDVVYKQFITLLSKYVDKFDKKDKFFLVGYNNASFDNQFLREWFSQNGDKYYGSWFWPNTLDVYILATQKFLNKRCELIDFKLKTVSKCAGIEVDESRLHDAIYDIELTRNLYKIVTL